MEPPDSDTSPDADSSSADSTSADSSPTQAQPSIGETLVMPAMEDAPVIHNDDSASDVSMSTDSEDEDDSAPNTISISATPIMQDLAQPAGKLGIACTPEVLDRLVRLVDRHRHGLFT